MRITGITELTQSRYAIEIDHEFAFVLYKGELRQYRIRLDGELLDADYQMIVREILPRRAKLRAMNLLKSREYTEEQLREKLRQGRYPDSVIEEAMDYIRSFHYVDDLRYATDYIRMHERTRSRRRIEQDLLGKGITQSILEQAFTDWQEQGGEQDEQAMIQALLEKKGFCAERADYKEWQKIAAFLQRKGFSYDQICHVMRGNCC
jgi:regulatory protein